MFLDVENLQFRLLESDLEQNTKDAEKMTDRGIFEKCLEQDSHDSFGKGVCFGRVY
jgi:hypothetical protein